jgi:hypothetical protein
LVLASLLTPGYITLYNQGIKFFGQPSLFLFNINSWPLIFLSIAGEFIGLAIKSFGQHGGLEVAQSRYAKTGRLKLPQPAKHASSSVYCIVEWCDIVDRPKWMSCKLHV